MRVIYVLRFGQKASRPGAQKPFSPLPMATLRGREHLPFSSSHRPSRPWPPLSPLVYPRHEQCRRGRTENILFAQMLHYAFQATILTHELQSRLWPDAFNWLEVVTAKEDAQVDEL